MSELYILNIFLWGGCTLFPKGWNSNLLLTNGIQQIKKQKQKTEGNGRQGADTSNCRKLFWLKCCKANNK